MDNEPNSTLTCANCGHLLDPTDKFCRECGLPTVRRVEDQQRVPPSPPGTAPAATAGVEPKPFVRAEPVEDEPPAEEIDETTSGVIRATSPTFAFQLASSTLVMVLLIVILAAAGVAMLVMAFRP